MASLPMTESPIVPRRVQVQFPPLPTKPLDWYDHSPAITEWFHALSVTFPAGETFFINSVRHFAPVLEKEHPELWRNVQLFFKQEGMHTAVHERWNRRIEHEFKHPMAELEEHVDAKLQEASSRLPPLTQLAITACLEHFTSGLGQIMLGTAIGQKLMQKSAEPYRSLLAWHAVEELEHKSVAFDVYNAMGGGFLKRTMVMLWIVAPIFLFRTTQIWYKLISNRPNVSKIRACFSLLQFLLVSPGALTRFLPHYLKWFNPWYHPSHDDDTKVIARWAAILESKRVLEPADVQEEENTHSPGYLLLCPDPVSVVRRPWETQVGVTQSSL